MSDITAKVIERFSLEWERHILLGLIARLVTEKDNVPVKESACLPFWVRRVGLLSCVFCRCPPRDVSAFNQSISCWVKGFARGVGPPVLSTAFEGAVADAVLFGFPLGDCGCFNIYACR